MKDHHKEIKSGLGLKLSASRFKGIALSFSSSGQFSSVAQSCLTLCDPVDCSMPGFPVHHQLPDLVQTRVHNHLILCHPLLILSIFPSIRVFSNESVLCIRWPKYWSFGLCFGQSTRETRKCLRVAPFSLTLG